MRPSILFCLIVITTLSFGQSKKDTLMFGGIYCKGDVILEDTLDFHLFGNRF